MFKDYYKILGIDIQASQDEIKAAYRELSKKWHPDRNPDLDVTAMMQDINEAYALLKDEVKRRRYDEEYLRFINHHKSDRQDSTASPRSHGQAPHHVYEYDVQDEAVNEDMRQAREYAKSLVAEFMKSFKKASADAAMGAWTGAKSYIVGGIIATILFALIRTCH